MVARHQRGQWNSQRDERYEGEVLPLAQKTPHWACHRCDRNNNWASRVVCQCGQTAPDYVQQRARAAAAKAAEAQTQYQRSPSSTRPITPWDATETQKDKEDIKRLRAQVGSLLAQKHRR